MWFDRSGCGEGFRGWLQLFGFSYHKKLPAGAFSFLMGLKKAGFLFFASFLFLPSALNINVFSL